MPEDQHVRIFRERPAFSREQKVALGLLLTFGSLAFIFGVFYLWKHIAGPFTITYTGPRLLVGDAKEAEEVRKAKRTDTDGDGVNDYEELNVYKTSPYLADSDSDGMNDMSEIVSGSDPSCATGQRCQTNVNDAEAQDLDDTFIEDAADQYGYTTQIDPSKLTSGIVIEDLVSAMSSEEIRSMLLESGADPEMLKQITDDELKALIVTVITEMQEAGEVPTDLSELISENDATGEAPEQQAE